MNIALPADVGGALTPGAPVYVYSKAHGGEPIRAGAEDLRYERYLDQTFGVDGWTKDVVDASELPHQTVGKDAEGNDVRAVVLSGFKMRDGKVDTGQATAVTPGIPAADRAAVGQAVADYLRQNLTQALKDAIADLQKGGGR